MEVQMRGWPFLLRGSVEDDGELAQAGGIRQHIRHPLPHLAAGTGRPVMTAPPVATVREI